MHGKLGLIICHNCGETEEVLYVFDNRFYFSWYDLHNLAGEILRDHFFASLSECKD